MEERSCNASLAYNLTIIDRPASKLLFKVKSDDVPLTINNKIDEYLQIRFIFGIIAFIALGLFVMALPRKMLGVEILNCCQMTLLSLCLY